MPPTLACYYASTLSTQAHHPPHPCPFPDTFQNFHGLCYNIQFKPYTVSKMELFVTKNMLWLEIVVSCYYIELDLKCERASRSNTETKINLD